MSEPFDFEGETDLELLGGVIDDEHKADPEPEPTPEPMPDPEPKAEEDPKPEEEGAPQPKRDAVIPRARFDEVNAKLHAEREEAARLRAELEALTKKPEPTDNNIDTLEDEYFEAMIAGDKTKAKEIRATINAEIFTRAQAASEEVVSTTLTQREIQSSFAKVVEQTVTDYPFLDSNSPDANAEAIGEVVEWRDFYLSKGDTPAAALQKAAAKIAPIYSKAADPTPEPMTDKRKQAAIANAAKASAAQPPAVEAGIGNRAIPFGDDIIGDQAKWEKASEAERLRMLS